jgi:predicted RecA/RadA family phage recombinase
MATNMIYKWTKTRPLTCSYPATPASGDPVLCGQIPGVALSAEDANGVTTVALNGMFTLSVKGENQSGNSAVADGDILYYEQGQTPPVNKDATNGVRFGYARGAVVSGATTSIAVEIGY